MSLRRFFAGLGSDKGAAVAEKIREVESHLQLGKLESADALCQSLLQEHADDYEVNCLAGEVSAKRANIQEAFQSFARAVELKPALPIAYYKRANVLRDSGRLEESLEDYSRAIALGPRFSRALCNRGVVLHRLRRLDEALDDYTRAIEVDPSDAFAHSNRAGVLRELKRPDEALQSYQQAVSVKPDYFEGYCNLGLQQAELGRFQAAMASYGRCIELNPAFSPAYFNQGVLLQSQRQWTEALSSYSRSIELDPGDASALSNRGVVLMELGQLGAAANDLDLAIRIRPNFAEAYLNLGNLLARQGSHAAAVVSYDKAIAHKADYADALFNRADALLQAREFESAVASYDLAYRVDPSRPYLKGMRLFARLNLCDWTNFESESAQILQSVSDEPSCSPPFPLLTLADRPDLQLKCAQSWVQKQCAIDRIPAALACNPASDKIRIGYFSGDFHIHPVSMLMAPVIECHDRSRFEIVAFSYGPAVDDDMRRRMTKAFDRFLDVRDRSDEDIARAARDLQIDIAIDLAGFTGNGRTKIFAWRAAPLQVNFLGYPGTMGANFMDYLIADCTVIPDEQREHYEEKIVSLPASFMPISLSRKPSPRALNREQYGLPAAGFVFCCFNNGYKLTPSVFEIWMRLLRRLPASVLWLSRQSELASRNLLREAGRLGVESHRVIFAQRLASHAEHLERHGLADLFLDTYPYNAHATAADALCARLPIVTRAGRGVAARVAASLLATFGMEELVTASALEYEELAFALATDPRRLRDLKERLERIGNESSRFDSRTFTANLEMAFSGMVLRQRSGLAPDHAEVAPDA